MNDCASLSRRRWLCRCGAGAAALAASALGGCSRDRPEPAAAAFVARLCEATRAAGGPRIYGLAPRRCQGHFRQLARAPRGHWIDARSANDVLGSRRKGSMGATAASFADAAAAQAFQAKHGGRVVAFADLRPEMVDLSGGALHDTKM